MMTKAERELRTTLRTYQKRVNSKYFKDVQRSTGNKATLRLEQTGGPISLRNKDIKGLRTELRRAKVIEKTRARELQKAKARKTASIKHISNPPKPKTESEISKVNKLTPADISNMNKEELLKTAKIVQRSVNSSYSKIINKLGPTGNFATRALDKRGGKITAKESMTVNELRKEIARGMTYYNYSTSTLGKYNQYVKDTAAVYTGGDFLTSAMYLKLSREEQTELWNIISMVKNDARIAGMLQEQKISTDELNLVISRNYFGEGKMLTAQDMLDRLNQLEQTAYQDSKDLDEVLLSDSELFTKDMKDQMKADAAAEDKQNIMDSIDRLERKITKQRNNGESTYFTEKKLETAKFKLKRLFG